MQGAGSLSDSSPGSCEGDQTFCGHKTRYAVTKLMPLFLSICPRYKQSKNYTWFSLNVENGRGRTFANSNITETGSLLL